MITIIQTGPYNYQKKQKGKNWTDGPDWIVLFFLHSCALICGP